MTFPVKFATLRYGHDEIPGESYQLLDHNDGTNHTG